MSSPGTETKRPLMQPSTISHHSTRRGSMVITRSPGLVPMPDSAFATCLERTANSRYVTSRATLSLLTQSIARLLGSPAHRSNTS